jgi:hypothetical protein
MRPTIPGIPNQILSRKGMKMQASDLSVGYEFDCESDVGAGGRN